MYLHPKLLLSFAYGPPLLGAIKPAIGPFWGPFCPGLASIGLWCNTFYEIFSLTYCEPTGIDFEYCEHIILVNCYLY